MHRDRAITCACDLTLRPRASTFCSGCRTEEIGGITYCARSLQHCPPPSVSKRPLLLWLTASRLVGLRRALLSLCPDPTWLDSLAFKLHVRVRTPTPTLPFNPPTLDCNPLSPAFVLSRSSPEHNLCCQSVENGGRDDRVSSKDLRVSHVQLLRM